MDWGALYADTARSLPDLARTTRPVLAGLTACVDKSVHLTDDDIRKLQRLKTASGPAKEFAGAVLGAVSAGRGGEYASDWEDGPAWIEDNLRTTEDHLGGTGARVAQTLAGLGGPAVLCLANRSPRMLGLVHPDVLLSSPSGLRRAGETPTSSAADNVHHILEFREDTRIGNATVPRSDRLIVRFGDLDLESSRDEHFLGLSRELARTCGAGVLSGFNELPLRRLRDGLRSSWELASAWRAGGLGLIHLELAGYRNPQEMRDVAAYLAEVCDSIGMNATELDGLIPGVPSMPSKLAQVADTYGLSRVCVHGDRWAMSLTTATPEKEMLALLTGSAVASSLARHGEVNPPGELPSLHEIIPPRRASFGTHRLGDRRLVACPVPYVERPAITVGLGDSFLAGTLLVLGNATSEQALFTPGTARFSA